MERYSIIIEDKNIYHALIKKTVQIIKDSYNGRFTVKQLTSLETFSAEEKEYLRSIFSPDIDELDIWGEHHFYFIKNAWEYTGKGFIDYRKTVRMIMQILNKIGIPPGTKVYTNDYQLISQLWNAWQILLENGEKSVNWKNLTYIENHAVIEFLSRNMQSRVGDSCPFDFAFIRTFMEARSDYYGKKLNDAIMGIESINN
ncbi:hypothetical protein ASZ90_006120 [hydrocarbon metagenome]|uniref:Uncharacterized protein n=1 Tax=hydrocarbon metagenome TaxID=938273 RepID=A0A0W8FT20_9ZZZZ